MSLEEEIETIDLDEWRDLDLDFSDCELISVC